MNIGEVRNLVMRGQHGYCAGEGCLEQAVELHHRMPNTKVTQKLYPLFLNSPFNCVGLCKKCHEQAKRQFSMTGDMAMAYEEYLRDDS